MNKNIINSISINSELSLSKALVKMNKYGFKSLAVVDKNSKYLGILSDGDARKSIVKHKNLSQKIIKIFQKKTIFYYEKYYTYEMIKKKFINNKIDIIPIINKSKKIVKIYFYADINIDPKETKKNFKIIPNTAAVIMCGGKGTRLKPYTSVLPKPLIPYKGKTLIRHVINQFINYKIKNFVFTINYKSQLIKTYFQELNPKINIDYIEEKNPQGTAGSLNKVNVNKFKHYFIANCDTVISANFHKLYKLHLKKKNEISIVAAKVSMKMPYGICNIKKNNELEDFKEKPVFKYIVNTGIYLVNAKILQLVPKENKFYHMTDLINHCKKINKKVGVYIIDDNDWTDLGKISSLQQTK